MAETIWLDVPYSEKDQAKALGARWDPRERRWFAKRDRAEAMARWLPPELAPLPPGPRVAVQVVALPLTCWRCGALVQALAGVVVGRAGWVFFDEVASALAVLVDEEEMAAVGIGPIRWRRSRPRPEGYLANGCYACDAILGSFPLYEELGEYLAEGGSILDLAVVTEVDMPACLLVDLEDP